jgi:hypothetical protein
MAMRKKKKPAKSKARKPAKRAPAKQKAARRKTVARKKAPSRPDPGAALAALARKIVKVTAENGDYLALYSPDIVSEEPTGEPMRGISGLEEKAKGWEQMQEGVTWNATTVATDPKTGTIVIEWDCQVKLRGGPTVPMREVAIHRVKNGKIVWERYYYNPAALAPPASDAAAM